MKNILVGIDFSENSKKATRFAIEIAKKLNLHVHFLHVYTIPIVDAESAPFYDINFYENIKKEGLDKFTQQFQLENISYENHSISSLSFIDEVNLFSKNKNIDLIVIGLTGSSALEELFLGSNALNLLVNSKTPILALPNNFEVTKELNFAFAYDNQDIKDIKSLNRFIEFSKKFNEKISIFHVNETDNKYEVYDKLKNLLNTHDFELTIELNSNIEKGISNFVYENKINILGLIPRKHNFIDRLFNASNTKEFARNSSIPILTIPESN